MRAMAMGSVLVLVALLAVCSADPLTLACGSCRTPTPRSPVTVPPVTVPPITVPPVTVPPITVPPVVRPPVTVPPVVRPPVTVPPVTVPPVVRPPVTVPPVTVPPVTLPPAVRPPVTVPPVTVPPVTVPPVTVPPVITLPPVIGVSPPSGGCPSPPSTSVASNCSMLKLGTCLDVLGNPVQIGDPAVECCSPLAGLTGANAALCLCTTIKAKLLDVNVYLPVALQFLASTCGKSIPPGYTCT